MGKGGMKRDNHHCTQNRRGGCRWVNEPVHRCYTHTFVCPIHNLAHQTYQSCLSCDGARLAVERALRNNQVSKNNPNSPQNKKNEKKWLASPILQSLLSQAKFSDGVLYVYWGRRLLSNIQSTAQDLTTLDHDSKALDNWFLTTCLTTRPQGAMAPKDGVFTTTFWFLAGLFVLLFWRIPWWDNNLSSLLFRLSLAYFSSDVFFGRSCGAGFASCYMLEFCSKVHSLCNGSRHDNSFFFNIWQPSDVNRNEPLYLWHSLIYVLAVAYIPAHWKIAIHKLKHRKI